MTQPYRKLCTVDLAFCAYDDHVHAAKFPGMNDSFSLPYQTLENYQCRHGVHAKHTSFHDSTQGDAVFVFVQKSVHIKETMLTIEFIHSKKGSLYIKNQWRARFSQYEQITGSDHITPMSSITASQGTICVEEK